MCQLLGNDGAATTEADESDPSPRQLALSGVAESTHLTVERRFAFALAARPGGSADNGARNGGETTYPAVEVVEAELARDGVRTDDTVCVALLWSHEGEVIEDVRTRGLIGQ